jgi:hypothetical protein
MIHTAHAMEPVRYNEGNGVRAAWWHMNGRFTHEGQEQEAVVAYVR